MARRSSIIKDISSLPWPVGFILALLCYPAAMLLKSYVVTTPVTAGLGVAISTIWPFVSAILLIASLVSFMNGRNKASIFKSHRSIEKIRNLSWQQFEQFTGSYFKDQGYFVVETSAGPDGGVDLVLRKEGKKTYVQCKHWKTYKVGVDKVRELLGAVTAGGADQGILVTTGEFTNSVIQFGAQHKIRLIAGKELEYLLRNKITVETTSTTTTKNQPACPLCQSKMILRIAKKGRNPGSQFWGCSRFPACRGTRTSK